MNRYEIVKNGYDTYGDPYYMDAPASAYRGQRPEPRIVEAARYAVVTEGGYYMVNFYDDEDNIILTMFNFPSEIRKLDAPAEVQE